MPGLKYSPLPRQERISVRSIVEKLQSRVHISLEDLTHTGNLDERFVSEVELHRPGLALAGYIELFTFHRIQVIGNTEAQYLSHLNEEKRREAFSYITRFDVPIIFLTSGNTLAPDLVEDAYRHGIPIFRTDVETTRFMFLLRDFLEDQFAMQTVIHGSMVDVYGIGILITGKSGIGKSEVALDLVERGHRLVADDVEMVTKKGSVLMASANEINKHFMEIRGLGIVEVMSMFGIRAIRYQKRLEVVVNLTLWEEGQHVERSGLDKEYTNILDIDIPLLHLPITPGKNITVIAEVIAMNHLLQHYGYDAAQAFRSRLEERIAKKKFGPPLPQRAVDYFESDFE
jgi:HPr kinase/phosphorylase